LQGVLDVHRQKILKIKSKIEEQEGELERLGLMIIELSRKIDNDPVHNQMDQIVTDPSSSDLYLAITSITSSV
jgi:hypothetical protein